MAREVAVVLLVVISDDVAVATTQLRDLRGRELPGVPGSWVSRVAVHADLEALSSKLTPGAPGPAGAQRLSPGGSHGHGGGGELPEDPDDDGLDATDIGDDPSF